MSPTVALISLIGVLGGVAGTVIAVLLKNSKKSPESRDVQTKGWDLLTGNLTKEIERVGKEQAELRQRVSDEQTAMRLELAQLRLQVVWHQKRTLQLTMAYLQDTGKAPPDAEDPEPMGS